MGRSFPPQNCPFAWGIWTPSNSWFVGPTQVYIQVTCQLFQQFFAGLTIISDRPTRHAVASVTVALNSVLRSEEWSKAVNINNIQPSSVVRDLGVYLDSELSMKQHVARTAAACFCHIRRLRQIRRRVGQEVTQQLVLALIMSRLDYCNSVLAGLPMSTLD